MTLAGMSQDFKIRKNLVCPIAGCLRLVSVVLNYIFFFGRAMLNIESL